MTVWYLISEYPQMRQHRWQSLKNDSTLQGIHQYILHVHPQLAVAVQAVEPYSQAGQCPAQSGINQNRSQGGRQGLLWFTMPAPCGTPSSGRTWISSTGWLISK